MIELDIMGYMTKESEKEHFFVPAIGPGHGRFRVDDVEAVRAGRLNWLGSSGGPGRPSQGAQNHAFPQSFP